MQNTTLYCPRTGRKKHFIQWPRLSARSTLFLTVLFLRTILQAQNLVPNGSFENMLTCPTANSFNGNLSDWYNPNTATPDYFHPCGVASTRPGTSSQLFGYQQPRTGQAMAGAGWYGLGGGFYDIMQNRFTTPLQQGTTYRVSFWVSLANGVRYASDDIGAYISDTSFKSSAIGAAPTFITNVVYPPSNIGPFTQFTPQIKTPDGYFISDTANWVEVSGLYTAHGGEQAITIGCFEPWATTGKMQVSNGDARVYYFFDDVSVVALNGVYNDMAITSLATPSIVCPGSQSIQVKVENMGKNKVYNFQIDWEVNGVLQAPVTYTQPIDTLGSASGNSRIITLGNTTLLPRTPFTIRAWTSYPNAAFDGVTSNDTLYANNLRPGISGTFTIGGMNPDYATINDAIKDIDTLGICGPVVFNIRTGTYTGKLSMNDIPGSSTINTVTFQSEANHKDSVVLTYASSSATDGTITLSAASYVIFRKLTVNQTNTAASSAIAVNDNSTYITIDSCTITTNASATSNTYAIYTASPGTKQLVISNNNITGGNTCINIAAVGDIYALNNEIKNNTILSSGANAISISYNTGSKINGNTIEINQPAATTYNAIWLSQCKDSFEITNNKIISIGTYSGTVTAIRLENATGSSTTQSLVANNHIAVSSSNTVYGLYSSASNNYNCYFNSVNVFGQGTAGAAGYFSQQSAASINIRNNIFSNKNSAGNAVYYYNPNLIRTNNNLFYAASQNIMNQSQPSAKIFSSLAAWQSSTGQDANSIVGSPYFTSDTDLNINARCNKGISLAGITNDITGITRTSTPNMGAYEYSGIHNIELIAVLNPAKGSVISGAQNMEVVVKNTGDNIITSFDVAYTFGLNSPVTTTWTGTLAPCDTAHILFTGSKALNITSSQLSALSVYTFQPNSTQDTYTGNDTLLMQVGTPLSGPYTIGGAGPDYADFAAAVYELNTRGISGAVTFNVEPATTYSQAPLLLKSITGNNVYPITFQKNGIGANPVIYANYGVGNTDAAITLCGTKNIIIDGIDIMDTSNAANGIEYGYRIIAESDVNGAYANTIKNTTIRLKNVNTATIGIVQSAAATAGGIVPASISGANHHNRYQNVTVTNCANGILLSGDALYNDTGNMITALAPDTNIIDGIGSGSSVAYGVQLINQTSAEVSNTIVRNLFTTNVSAYGIYVNNLNLINSGNVMVKNNRVQNIFANSTSTSANGGPVGLMIELNTSATAKVYNNIVYNLSRGNLSSANANVVLRGILHCYSGNGSAEYFNNMVLVNSDLSLNASSAAFWKSGNGTVNLMNNVFVNTTANQSGNARHYALFMNNVAPFTSSNNLLWSAGNNGFIGGYNAGFYTTLSNWKTATGQENNSISFLPNLDVNNFLYPVLSNATSWLLNGRGAHNSSNGLDMNGNIRPASVADGVPDIGAYEFTPSALPPIATAIPAFISPYQPVDTVQVFMYGTDTVASIKWSAGFDIQPLSVRQFSGEKPEGVGAFQNHMYFYTSIEPQSASSFLYDVDIYYRKNWIGTNPDENNIRLANATGTNTWTLVTSSSVDIARNKINGQYLNMFYTFSGTDVYIPMPVKLIQFKGVREDNNIVLTWNTASELNNKGFEVQFSIDGKTFKSIGFVSGSNNPNTVANYRFVHPKVLMDKNATLLYYRLKQVDHDGTTTLSDIVTIRNESVIHESTISLYPNPFKEEVFLNIYAQTTSASTIEIVDITGKTIIRENFDLVHGDNKLEMEAARELQSGVYIISVTINEVRQTYKLVKQ